MGRRPQARERKEDRQGKRKEGAGGNVVCRVRVCHIGLGAVLGQSWTTTVDFSVVLDGLEGHAEGSQPHRAHTHETV